MLSFQPYSLYAAGGGSRILRRLYEGKEAQITSLVVSGYPSNYKGTIHETVVYAKPMHRRWMRSFVRDCATWLRVHTFYNATEKAIQQAALKQEFDVVHIVNHNIFSTSLCNEGILTNKVLWVSFHDHFLSIGSTFEQARLLWEKANRRLVITKELGDEYNRLFGEKQYEIITDGVSDDEITFPSAHGVYDNENIVVYFAGLLHLDYQPLFRVLADGLDMLSAEGKNIKLLLRGTQRLDFLENRKFSTEYKPLIVDNKVLKEELDSATILYFPMKYTDPEFYKYSLSTKMVGYLGAPGTILYHGPADCGACLLLKNHQAALVCENLVAADLAQKIKASREERLSFSKNGKQLASSQFNIANIRKRFWQAE
jgi:glycosyltransferase involved in cell wall biosynthesis